MGSQPGGRGWFLRGFVGLAALLGPIESAGTVVASGGGVAVTCPATPGRHFLPDNTEHDPPVLWTTPGAGNTWVRQLIEAATGVHSGSMYTDESLVAKMPGEKRCDRTVSVIKGHPEHRTFDMIFNLSLADPCTVVPADAKSKCTMHFARYTHICGRPTFMRRAVAVVRDPFKSFLAEYQRFWKQETDRLSGVKAAAGDNQHTVVMRELDPKQFYEWAIPASRQWIEDWRQYAKLAKLGRDRIHFVRYEDLIARNLRALADLVGFVVASGPVSSSGKSGSGQPRVTRAQLHCAFEHAASGSFKRPTADKQRLENRAYLSMTPGRNETTACAVWREIGALGSRLGYAPPLPCGMAGVKRVSGDILALADRARIAGLTRPRSLAAPVDSRILLPACGPQHVSVRVKNHGTYVAVARLTCERTLEEEFDLRSSFERTTLVGLQVIQTKSALKSTRGSQRVYVRKRLYEKRIEVPRSSDWQWRGFGSLMLNPGSFDVVVEGATPIYRDECRVSHVGLMLAKNGTQKMMWASSTGATSSANPLVWDCGEGATSKTNKRRATAVDTLRRRAVDGVVVLSVASKELAALALNWAIHLERNSVFNYAIGALDDETLTRLALTLGAPVFRVPTRESRHAASFFDVTLGVPELSVLYVDVRAILVSSHVYAMLGDGPGMRCAPKTHCSTLLWLPRAKTAEGLALRERLVEELSVLRPLPESRTTSSLSPLDKPAWPALNAALNSIDFVSPLTSHGEDVVVELCAIPPPANGRLIAVYTLCPRPLQVLRKRVHSRKLKVFFDTEYQADLGWALTPYTRFAVDAAAKAKGTTDEVMSRDDFFSDVLAHLEMLPKSPPRNQLHLFSVPTLVQGGPEERPVLSVLITAPRAVSLQAQVEAVASAAQAAEARFEVVVAASAKALPYKPYNLWHTLTVILVQNEADYKPRGAWIARLASDALLSTDFGLWFARFRRSVDATEAVRVVAPCVASVANLLYGSSKHTDDSFDRLDCAESHTVAGKLECQAWLADHVEHISVNGVKRRYDPEAAGAASPVSSNATRYGGLLTPAGQLAIRSFYQKKGALATALSATPVAPKKSSWPGIATTRSLKNCWALLGSTPPDRSTSPAFEMRSRSAEAGAPARVEVLPSALMVLRHSEQRPAAMPLSSPSSLARLEKLTPARAVADLELFGPNPHKGLEVLASMNVFLYVVETVGGLANRLRAVSTGWSVANKLGRPLIVSWPIDPECEAQPAQLFDLSAVHVPFINRSWPELDKPVVVRALNKLVRPVESRTMEMASKRSVLPPRAVPERGTVLIKDTLYDGTKSAPKDLDRPVHLHARTQRHAIYSRYWSFFLGYNNLDVRTMLHSLSPSPFVSSQVRTEAPRVHNAVGIHVRMQWNETEMVKDLDSAHDESLLARFNRESAEALRAYKTRRGVCNMDNFKTYMSDKFFKKNPQASPRFFVACDVPHCLENFDSGERAGKIVRNLQHHDQLVARDCWRDSRSPICQQLAFVDLHLLAACSQLIISKHSSFSDMASLLSVAFRPNDELIGGQAPRDQSVESACGFINDSVNKPKPANPNNAPGGDGAKADDANATLSSRRWRRPTRAEIYRKQLFLIQAARRKQQNEQKVAAAANRHHRHS